MTLTLQAQLDIETRAMALARARVDRVAAQARSDEAFRDLQAARDVEKRADEQYYALMARLVEAQEAPK